MDPVPMVAMAAMEDLQIVHMEIPPNIKATITKTLEVWAQEEAEIHMAAQVD